MSAESKEHHDSVVGLPCAFCYRPLSETPKRCSKCLKRAYCSRECQVADWKTDNGVGQGHKTWCSLGSGEEGIDWEVKYISEEKGYGVVALRDFAPNERIMVERVFRMSEVDAQPRPMVEAINALDPRPGTVEDKFLLNAMQASTRAWCEGVLSVRMARANHSCGANAYHYYEEAQRVRLLFCRVPIRAGDEICIEYARVKDPATSLDPEEVAEVLKSNWGIVCPEDCVCKDKEILAQLERANYLDGAIFRVATGDPPQPRLALRKAEELLQIHEKLKQRADTVLRTLYDAFQVALTSKETQKEAGAYAKRVYQLSAALMGEKSYDAQEYKKYMEDPLSHPAAKMAD